MSIEAMRKALNYIENTEGELGIKLSCGDALREALAAQPPAAPVETGRQVSCAVGGKPYADSHQCSSAGTVDRVARAICLAEFGDEAKHGEARCCQVGGKDGCCLEAVRPVAEAAIAAIPAEPQVAPTQTFYGARCAAYPNCSGGCGCGCTHEIGDVEARIAVLSDALKRISKNTCCDNCQEAARVARSALGAYVGLARQPEPLSRSSAGNVDLTPEQVSLVNDMIHAWIDPEKKGEFREAFRNDCKRLLATVIPAQPQKSAVISAADWERVFQDACDEAGCEYDNEALLSSIANLTSYVDMLWAWFRERRGSEDMRANVANGGFSADDFKQMLDDHEANLIPAQPQAAQVPEDPEMCWHTSTEAEGELVVTQYELAAAQTALREIAGMSHNCRSVDIAKAALAVTRPEPQPSSKTPADDIISQIEERFPNWRSYRDLLDCIDCTLHQLRTEAQP